jgi:hypothetical protein
MHGRTLMALAFLPAFIGCSCRSVGSARPDAGARDSEGSESDQRDAVAPQDADQRDTAAWPDGGVASLDVPWAQDDTRKLQPIEIPWDVPERDCGPSCWQVTFMSGWPGDGPENTYNVSGDLLVTNTRVEGRMVAVYVDLATRKAYAFGVMGLNLPPQNTACGLAVVDGGRIAYSCQADAQSAGYFAEARLFIPASRQEQRLWQLAPGAPPVMPSGLGFLGEQLSMMRADTCQACGAIFVMPLTGGPGTQVFPPAGQEGGIDAVQASGHYIVWGDMAHFSSGVQVGFLDVAGTAAAARVTGTGGDHWAARVKGRRVAWMDSRNDPQHGAYDPRNTDIYAKDLVTGEEWAACTDVARQESPDVEGDIVVWTDFRNSDNPYPTTVATHTDIYAANVHTGQEWRLTDLQGLATDVRIEGGRAFFFWGLLDGNPPQVFMIDLGARGILQNVRKR